MFTNEFERTVKRLAIAATATSEDIDAINKIAAEMDATTVSDYTEEKVEDILYRIERMRKYLDVIERTLVRGS